MVDGVELSRASLHFGASIVGVRKTRALPVRSSSRREQLLTLSATAPFSVPPTLILPAGAEVQLKVALTPTALGPLVGSVTVGGSLAVLLEGEGAPVPACVAPDVDRMSLTTRLAFAWNRSRSMACVGPQRDCTDNNPCTVDACDFTSGCVHSTVIYGSADPCKAGRCDPSSGCTLVDVDDGTRCGENGCVLAQVCIVGTCKAVAAPEGSRWR